MQKLKFLAPYMLGVACALPRVNHAPSNNLFQDRCMSYESSSFQRLRVNSSRLTEHNNARKETRLRTTHSGQNESSQITQTNCNLSLRAVDIVRNKVAEVLGETRANSFVDFALEFRVVIISQENLIGLLANQTVNTTDRSSIVGHYDPTNRLIYISSNLGTDIDRLSTLSHEFTHVAMDYFGGNYENAARRPLLIREGFPALLENEVRIEFEAEFGPSERFGSYPLLRAQLLDLCNSFQGTIDQPCTSKGFRAFMFYPNGGLRSQ